MNELYRDGTVAGEGGYLGPNKHGEWSYYHRNGQLKARGRYEDGELAGDWVWFGEDGGLLQRGHFVDGHRQGPWERFAADGSSLEAHDAERGLRADPRPPDPAPAGVVLLPRTTGTCAPEPPTLGPP